MGTKIVRTPGETLETVFGTTTRKAVANILSHWAAASAQDKAAGLLWYPAAGAFADELAAEYGVSRAHVATAIAHLSPRTNWQANKAAARALLAGTGKPSGIIGSNWDRAAKSLTDPNPLATLNGIKTRNFAHNILGNEDAVTVDVWAMRVALGYSDDGKLGRVGAYDALAHAYRVAAKRVGVSPAVLQATTWTVIRGTGE
ncbi:hypothetical protein GS534_24540 [Rhodococcus hoagii]|nr:hypothetical protein [Prescottella equi]MBM4617901.1 hypothetical protein [Prescottella equi]NKS33199.1 hypothetical protein [Prescottella equi]